MINNSWGFPKFSKLAYVDGDIFKLPTSDYDSAIASYNAWLKQSAKTSMDSLLQLLFQGYDILVVQSAGNGLDNNGAPQPATESSGAFGSITEELFHEVYPDGFGEIDYDALNHHILIVGAIKNQLTDDGNYVMNDNSNYGPAVDICAPGLEIFTTGDSTYPIYHEWVSDDADYTYLTEFSGTSAAAPMVSGAAALLWSIDPDLTARQVWDLLVNNNEVMAEGTKDHGHPFEGSEGTYPVLNIGSAVRALMKEKNEALVSELQITDLATGEPVEARRSSIPPDSLKRMKR